MSSYHWPTRMENWKYSVNSINDLCSHPFVHQMLDSPSFPYVTYIHLLALRETAPKSYQSQDALWVQNLQVMLSRCIREEQWFLYQIWMWLLSIQKSMTKKADNLCAHLPLHHTPTLRIQLWNKDRIIHKRSIILGFFLFFFFDTVVWVFNIHEVASLQNGPQ